MTAYGSTSEAIFTILRDDDYLQEYLGVVIEEGEDVAADPRIYKGYPDRAIELTADNPAYLILTKEGNAPVGSHYGDDELWQIRVIANSQDLLEDIEYHVRRLIEDHFTMCHTTAFLKTAFLKKLHLGGGNASCGPGEYDEEGDFYSVNIRFSVESYSS